MARVSPIKNISEERVYANYLSIHYEREYIFWQLSRNSGYRVSDLLKLRVGDIRDVLAQGAFIIREQKTGHPRRVALKTKLRKILEKHIEGKGDEEYILLSRQGRNKAVSSRQIGRNLKKAAEACGLDINIGTHSGRKTFAYHLFVKHGSNEKALLLVHAILGHSTIEMTMKYIGIYEDAQDSAVMSIPEL